MKTSLLDMDRNSRVIEDSKIMDVAYNIQTLLSSLNDADNVSTMSVYEGDHRSKKSQNTTECVPVPSSEHVAEIVGRQGCKIKALRAKTNTYIKTPVRGEEPVFVVTGRKEDVASAKREILSAADHFSAIRAQRKNNLNGTLVPGPNSIIPGQTTIQVRVPYRVVGLVVGPKGATIKRIQQTTNTYIVTPSREKEPIFDVTGLPENVENARKEIEAHIAMRTGGSVEDGIEDYNSNPFEFTNNLNALTTSSFFKGDATNNYICQFRDSNNVLDLHNVDNLFTSFSGSSSRNVKQNNYFNTIGGFGGFGRFDNEDIADSPSYDTPGASLSASSWPDFPHTVTENGMSMFGSASMSASSLSDLSRSNSLTGPIGENAFGEQHPPARRIHSEPVTITEVSDLIGSISLGLGTSLAITPYASTAPSSLMSGGFNAAVSKCTSSSSSSPIESLAPGKKPSRDCQVCYESEIVAALVPCGHNLFCMECAQRIADDKNMSCPFCYQPVESTLRLRNGY
ncbi:RNA-binding protein MEX3B-like [Argiope bruennichi]|uniref:RNA-binding E3 ubiquitin-protein ligase MEX3C like protein n=1 Tax=Argiope bruennichi TaxID=94029 RepID=A0A8T0FR31_ARGBR|nr:RNA-binding protein MEX3B-like [Argiope bruennichi]KAF8793062.1 RNA-binding E3 ubiquitin-protein ligase MEX3C like protein [Argiope bruennichi]